MQFSLDLKVAALTVSKEIPACFSFNLDEQERMALALRFGFLAIDRLRGAIEIRQIARSCWQLEAQITGRVIQSCVITAEAVPEDVDFSICERYVEALDDAGEVDPTGVDTEILDQGMILVGEAVAQALAVHVCAWPRHSDAPELNPPEDISHTNNPFAKLSELKK